MFDPVLREDCFPFVCCNDACQKPYDKDDFIRGIETRGLIYIDCGEKIFQGFNCQACGQITLLYFPRTSPLVDLRQFYMMPSSFAPVLNIQEQFFEENRRGDASSPLDFNFIFPLWDPEAVSKDDVKASISASLPDVSNRIGAHEYIPYVMDNSEIPQRFLDETNTQQMFFRRLYPKDTFWYCLLFSIVPGIITPSCKDESGLIRGWDGSRMSSPVYYAIFNTAMRYVVEKSSGYPLADKIREKMDNCDITTTDEDIEAAISEHQLDYYFSFHDTLAQLSLHVDFVRQAMGFANRVFWKLYYSVCSAIYLSDKRTELSKWVHNVEPGKALFVDAPMGLGKSYSIVETLVDNPELSAVIFMPTKKLCEETVHRLKSKLAHKQNINHYEIYHNQEEARDDNGNVICDEDIIPEYRFTRDFLWREVYYADGINKYECPGYEKIVNRYANLWIKKTDICDACKNLNTCRFLKHHLLAPASRIVITTHLQYEALTRYPEISKWYKEGPSSEDANTGKSASQDRDFFIVDEDIVLSRCYQPIELTQSKFKRFVSAITEAFGSKHFKKGVDVKEIEDYLLKLKGQFDLGDETMVIAPINPEYKLSEDIKEKWLKISVPEYQWFVPDYLHDEGIVPNYLEVFENTVRHGYVVQAYQTKDGNGKTKKIRKAYLPNPTRFNLAKLPPHVFFDGTMIDERFLKNKLQNVSFEKVKIGVPSIWTHRIRQNINADLPRKHIAQDREAVKAFIEGVLREEGPGRKYFIVCLKETREAYLEEYVRTGFPGHNIVLNHYGNLRGFNEAKDCDIGIMVGSYIVPDALEVAMSLELFTDDIKPTGRMETEGKMWRWVGKKPVREYYPEYSIVGEMAKSIQLTEHRQAIARTRYISHDVDFYIISRVPLNAYDPYFPEVETDQYRVDLFPPRKPRHDSKYNEVKSAVDEWFSTNYTVITMDLHKKTGIGRRTVSKHLKTMFAEGLLGKASKTKYKLPEN